MRLKLILSRPMTPSHEVRKHLGRRSTGLVAIAVDLAGSSLGTHRLLHLGIVDTGELRCRPGRRRRNSTPTCSNRSAASTSRYRRSSTTRTPNHTRSRPARALLRKSRTPLSRPERDWLRHYMDQIEAASPDAARKAIVAQHVLGLPDDTPNPHLWYDPTTMPAVASAMATDLGELEPAPPAYFRTRLRPSTPRSGRGWPRSPRSRPPQRHARGVTEPVSDYLLQAMGADIVTPFPFQADIMNGVDPSPEAITQEEGLFTNHAAKVFCYNQQVVSSLTATIRHTAQSSGVPSSVSTKPCRRRGTTINPGWRPKSRQSRQQWSTAPRRSTCEHPSSPPS